MARSRRQEEQIKEKVIDITNNYHFRGVTKMVFNIGEILGSFELPYIQLPLRSPLQDSVLTYDGVCRALNLHPLQPITQRISSGGMTLAWQYKLLLGAIAFLGISLLTLYKDPLIDAIRNCQMRENYEYENRWNKMCAEIGAKWGDCLVPVSIQQAKGISWQDHLDREQACEQITRK